jgi:hypothetical protein
LFFTDLNCSAPFLLDMLPPPTPPVLLDLALLM